MTFSELFRYDKPIGHHINIDLKLDLKVYEANNKYMGYSFLFFNVKCTKFSLTHSNWLYSENIQPRHLKFLENVTFVKLQK
jgi:hypothetical protein